MRPTRLALFVIACSGEAQVPNIADPLCGRVAAYPATAGEGECILLSSGDTPTLFQRAEWEGCDAVPCLRLEPGETAFAMVKVTDQERENWPVVAGACELVPECPAR